MSNITRLFNRTMLKIEKNAPKILFVAGMIGFGSTVVASGKAAVKAQPILEEHREEMAEVEASTYAHTQGRTTASVKVYQKTGVKLAKVYAPTAVLGVISVACLTKSHTILVSRNAAITAAFTGLSKTFAEYRQRVVEDMGIEKDTQYAHGQKAKEIADYDENGNLITKYAMKADPDIQGIYTRMFDENNSRFWEKAPGYNSTFLSSQQQSWNLELKTRGHVFLNDVLKSIGFPETKEGQIVGWVHNAKDADGYIDFGFNRYPDFVAGYERSVMLEFNCDGNILDLI